MKGLERSGVIERLMKESFCYSSIRSLIKVLTQFIVSNDVSWSAIVIFAAKYPSNMSQKGESSLVLSRSYIVSRKLISSISVSSSFSLKMLTICGNQLYFPTAFTFSQRSKAHISNIQLYIPQSLFCLKSKYSENVIFRKCFILESIIQASLSSVSNS